jgi:hypothetical protein
MALYAVSIEKDTVFHGRTERFANIYYFEGPSFQAGDANYKRVCDALVAAERLVHNSEVFFRGARIWSSGGTIAQNVTLGMFDYSGPGAMGSTSPLHAETAVLVQWECSRTNILGRKVYLSKYIRSQHLPAGGTFDMARGKEALTSQAKALYKAYADTVQNIEAAPGAFFLLASPTGRLPRAGDIGEVDSFVRSREFRRN